MKEFSEPYFRSAGVHQKVRFFLFLTTLDQADAENSQCCPGASSPPVIRRAVHATSKSSLTHARNHKVWMGPSFCTHTQVSVVTGPADKGLATLAARGVRFDLAFLDADKGGYLDYFNRVAERHKCRFLNLTFSAAAQHSTELWHLHWPGCPQSYACKVTFFYQKPDS